MATEVKLQDPTWMDRPLPTGERALAQTSAHGRPAWCTFNGDRLSFDEPQRLVAPGQTVALYDASDPESVLGAAKAA